MENAGIFYGHLVYVTVIWYMLRPFGLCYGHLVYFVFIWYLVQRQIWQPCTPVKVIDSVAQILLTEKFLWLSKSNDARSASLTQSQLLHVTYLLCKTIEIFVLEDVCLKKDDFFQLECFWIFALGQRYCTFKFWFFKRFPKVYKKIFF
jgi:hypothetical protein